MKVVWVKYMYSQPTPPSCIHVVSYGNHCFIILCKDVFSPNCPLHVYACISSLKPSCALSYAVCCPLSIHSVRIHSPTTMSASFWGLVSRVGETQSGSHLPCQFLYKGWLLVDVGSELAVALCVTIWFLSFVLRKEASHLMGKLGWHPYWKALCTLPSMLIGWFFLWPRMVIFSHLF